MATKTNNTNIQGFDINKMSQDDILAQIAKLQGILQENMEQEFQEFKDTVKSKIGEIWDYINSVNPIMESGERKFYIDIKLEWENSDSHIVGITEENGKKIPFKWQSIDGKQKWTGRGMTPRWIMAILEKEKINIEEFKTDKRFIIPIPLEEKQE